MRKGDEKTAGEMSSFSGKRERQRNKEISATLWGGKGCSKEKPGLVDNTARVRRKEGSEGKNASARSEQKKRKRGRSAQQRSFKAY